MSSYKILAGAKGTMLKICADYAHCSPLKARQDFLLDSAWVRSGDDGRFVFFKRGSNVTLAVEFQFVVRNS